MVRLYLVAFGVYFNFLASLQTSANNAVLLVFRSGSNSGTWRDTACVSLTTHTHVVGNPYNLRSFNRTAVRL